MFLIREIMYCKPGKVRPLVEKFKIMNEMLKLPRADNAERIARMEAEQLKLLRSLQGTSLNLKTFIPLVVKYNVSSEFPSNSKYRQP